MMCIEAGVDLLEVQKILGHRSVLTTARYIHLTATTNWLGIISARSMP